MSQPACAHVVSHVCEDLNQETTHENILLRTHKQPTETSGIQVIPLSTAFSPALRHVSLYNIMDFIHDANKTCET